MGPETWFNMIWEEQERTDPTHGGISKGRAREVFEQAWREMDDIFANVDRQRRDEERPNRSQRDGSREEAV